MLPNTSISHRSLIRWHSIGFSIALLQLRSSTRLAFGEPIFENEPELLSADC